MIVEIIEQQSLYCKGSVEANLLYNQLISRWLNEFLGFKTTEFTD